MVTRRLQPLLIEGRVVHQIGLPFHWAFAGEIVGGNANDLTALLADPNVSMHEGKAFACQVYAGRLAGRLASPTVPAAPWPTRDPIPDTPAAPSPKGGSDMASREKELAASATRPATRRAACSRRCWDRLRRARSAAATATAAAGDRFYTDTTVCIGCKACEVACKQWNQLPADGFHWTGNSYDNTGELSATSWRHVKFIEQFPRRARSGGSSRLPVPLRRRCPTASRRRPSRWLMMSDVCKHCVAAPCQQACPTGAIIYNEFDNVYIQPDICNGCSYCIAACPFGVITRSHFDGHSHKCTLCYDRQRDGLVPACAKACPTAVDPVRPDRRAARAGPQARRGTSRPRRAERLPLRRRSDRDLFRAAFVLSAGRSSLGVRPAGDTRSTRGCT